MVRTKKRDFWLRLGLIFIMAFSILPYAQIDSYSLALTIPVAIFVWLAVIFFLLAFIDQLNPIIDGTREILVKIYKKVFSYIKVDISEDDRILGIMNRSIWCVENLQNFWFEINGIYFFLYKRDAMAFKLVWV